MPTTVNSPKFWNTLLDNFINKSERVPQSDGSYLFKPEETDETVIAPDMTAGESNLYPQGNRTGKMNPADYYNDVMGTIESENKRNVPSYNMQSGRRNTNPDLVDAVRQWIAGGGSKRF